MHHVQLLFLVAVLPRAGWARVYCAEHVRELRLDEWFGPLLPEVLRSRDTHLLENGNCSRDLTAFRQTVARRYHWAVKISVLDSSSKMPTGLMRGNLVDLGMFDDCIDVVEDDIRGRHCVYSLDSGAEGNFLPLKPTLSIRLLASCTKDDIMWLANDRISASNDLKKLGVKVGNANCTIPEPRAISIRLIIFLLVASLIYRTKAINM